VTTSLTINQGDLRDARIATSPSRALGFGESRLLIESFGLTSNNITYADMGNAMGYWQFFPGPHVDDVTWGHLPVWGFGRVDESTSAALSPGQRVFGYFPCATELIVTPGRVDDSGFSDVVIHRQPLPSVYNRYAFVLTDPLYDENAEGTLMLLRPLFVTSFTVDDFLADNDDFGATTIVLSSASSKTAIASAFLLKQRGLRVVALTSDTNVRFTSSLDLYDDVVTYELIDNLARTATVYIDVAGRRDVTRRVHEHLDKQLRYSMIVGDTHWDATPDDAAGTLVGPAPTLLFAPTQIAKRRSDWGRDGFENRVASSWHTFTQWSTTWLEEIPIEGADDIRATYLNLVNGRIDPRVGHVCRF